MKSDPIQFALAVATLVFLPVFVGVLWEWKQPNPQNKRMGRFTLKDLFVLTTIVAVGVGMILAHKRSDTFAVKLAFLVVGITTLWCGQLWAVIRITTRR